MASATGSGGLGGTSYSANTNAVSILSLLPPVNALTSHSRSAEAVRDIKPIADYLRNV